MLQKILKLELLSAIFMALIIIFWEYYILSLAITTIIIYTISLSYVIYLFTIKDGTTKAPHGLIVSVLFGIPLILILLVSTYLFHGSLWFSISETILFFLIIPFVLEYVKEK
jgi:hypothetical protein